MSSSVRQTKADVVAEFRRSQILAAARDCFVGQGVADTTVDDIAKAAHVAKGTVYLYYRSKDEILRQLLVEDLAELRDGTVPDISRPGAVDERLRRYVSATLDFFERKRDFIDHCQLELSPDVRRKVRVTLGQLYDEQIAAWDRALQQAVGDGTIAAADTAGAATNIVGMARGLALQRLAGWCDEPIGTCAARASTLLWKGLATR